MSQICSNILFNYNNSKANNQQISKFHIATPISDFEENELELNKNINEFEEDENINIQVLKN
ncbi:11270_t:CDS:1, partial [Dentiscutata erythropus]